MNKNLLIDSDVLIDFLRGSSKAQKFLEKSLHTQHCCISSITVCELYAGVREGKERDILNKFITIFHIVAVDEKIAEMGGLLRRDYRKSHGTGLVDAIIAATAQTLAAKIATLNTKHFPMFKNLKPPYKK